MKKFLFLILLLYCLLPLAKGQLKSYWQQQVNYKIDVLLNDTTHTLDGYVKMDYYNNSPDTLYFIWIHLWPNAYKNDRTAFSNQMLENGSTNFYFTDNDSRGYINRLNFSVNTLTAKTEDHLQHQDIIKLILPTPLAPKSNCKIETPFHVKLPYNFSRGGHVGQSYQITQWYPKPAVYDKTGWHTMPYLDQGEFYSEFGNYEVQITLPKNYVVAATGQLQDEEELNFLQKGKIFYSNQANKIKSKTAKEAKITSANETKTIHYVQNNVHDFAWFADKSFLIQSDTLQLPSGKIINVYAYYFTKNILDWANSISFIKQAIITKCKWIGEYPYNTATIVDNAANTQGGMEYPTITLLTSGGSQAGLQRVINHEVGHNWFYGILATNERDFVWMDEGMNTFYDKRYASIYYNAKDGSMFVPKQKWLKNRFPDYPQKIILQTQININKDQPINTASEKFSQLNYDVVAYEKAGDWMQLLENELGKPLFDSCIKAYYNQWAFKHPYPEDFKKIFEETSGKNLDSIFSLLNKKGNLVNKTTKKDLRFTPLFNFKETEKHHYIGIAPAIGYNFYDKIMMGAVLHNYNLLATKFQFVAVPLFATGSKKFNFIGNAKYSWYPGNNGQKFEASLAASFFTNDVFTDSLSVAHFLRFSKFVPTFKYIFANSNPRSSFKKYIQWKTFFINEQQVLFSRDTIRQVDVITYPKKQRYLNQLQFVVEDSRVLYPYKSVLQIEQGDGWLRTSFTGNCYFNYAKGGGLNVRVFAGKFIYTGPQTYATQAATDAYHLNMTGPKGYEDYTYSNYFVGRNEYDRGQADLPSFLSQQIMIRDGGFKVRTDFLSNKIGRTDNWLVAANFTADIPKVINPLQVLPIKIPLKVFFDVGTYAEAWQNNAPTGHFLYDAGLQISLLKNTINIYIPLLYSSVYANYFKSTIPQYKLLKNIAFSIDIQNATVKKFIPQIPF